MNIAVRPAQASDSAAMKHLLAQIVQTHHVVRPDIFRASYESKAGYHEDADAPVFVAVDENGAVVGCLWCVIVRERDNSLKNDRDWLCIDDLCVDVNYRKHGIGQRLVDFAVHFAQQNGLPRIELNVYQDNENAVHFYKAYGFRTQKRVMELDVPAWEEVT